MRIFSLERIEILLNILREIFEVDLLWNLDLNRLEIYTSISLEVIKELITCVTKASRKTFYEQTTSLDFDFVYEPFYDSNGESIPELVMTYIIFDIRHNNLLFKLLNCP